MSYKIRLLILSLIMMLASCTRYDYTMVVNYCNGQNGVIHASGTNNDFVGIRNGGVAVPELYIGHNTVAYNVCGYIITEKIERKD